MDFDFSEDQKALRQAVHDTLSGRFGRDHVRLMLDDQRGFSDEFWSTIAGLGWTGLLVPEEHGGLGMDLIDAVVLQEEMGRAAMPGPYFSSAIFATLAAHRLAATELLPGLASGLTRGTVAIDEGGSRDPFAAITTRALETANGWVLEGTKPTVPDGHTADWVIVAARVGEGIGAFLVEQPGADAVPSVDPTRKLARLELAGTPARRLGGADAEAVLRRVMDDASIGLCAELVGCCEQSLHLAQEYARTRVQFGRPIGSFQAIKHMAAEMLQKTELARVGAHYAAWTSVQDTSDREQAVAMAKSWCAQAAIEVTGASIQIHGGVGFTWETDPHLYYKRAKVNDLLLGQQGWQRQRVADLVLGPVAATG